MQALKVPHSWFSHFYDVGLVHAATVYAVFLRHAAKHPGLDPSKSASALALGLLVIHLLRRFAESNFMFRASGKEMHATIYIFGIRQDIWPFVSILCAGPVPQGLIRGAEPPYPWLVVAHHLCETDELYDCGSGTDLACQTNALSIVPAVKRLAVTAATTWQCPCLACQLASGRSMMLQAMLGAHTGGDWELTCLQASAPSCSLYASV